MISKRMFARSHRRIKTRLPSGKIVFHYRKKRPNFPACAICKQPLHGVKPGVPQSRASKSEKTVARPYGGKLCGKCFRDLMKSTVREAMLPLISS
ncbi:MAG: 50S ribosomal protein L34e [Candidatus Odinarchaeia archaeon]